MSCNLRFVAYFCLTLCACVINASIHWIVTEDGKLSSQSDSVYNMKRPHDLAAFMNQEQRVKIVDELREEILNRQEIVDSSDDKDEGFEEKFLSSEASCVKAGKRLPDFDLYISTVLPLENKGIKAEEHINLKDPPSTELSSPHCAKSPLDFSIHAFEHLLGVQNRKHLAGMHELGLKSAITHRESEDEYGHLVNEALKLNRTSWVLYNMAAFYWRIKGDPFEAIECLRRAMHYSPRSHRDVAYVSLGNILHRARHSTEAAIVLTAALDISPDLNVNHFTLGNIYAVLTQYNKSVEYFDNTLAIQPDFEAAEKRKWAVICHARLEKALEEQHKSLQSALEELKGYQKKHETIQTLTEKMVSEQATLESKTRSDVEFDLHLQARKNGDADIMGETCDVIERDGEPTVNCTWKKKKQSLLEIDESKFSSIPVAEDVQEKVKEMKPLRKNQPLNQRTTVDYSKPLRPPLYGSKKKSKSNDKAKTPVYHDPNWPSRDECDAYKVKVLEWNEYPTTYLPAENKGFDSRVFLAEAIDIPFREQHPLPWYPPVCVNIVDLKQGEMSFDNLQAIKERDKIPIRLSDPTMRETMLSWVNNGDVEEEEVGQRILTALKQNLAPRWLLYNLAGLYWRVVGNNYHGVECLRRSLHFVPADYFDVPLVNMANVLYKWNKLDDALNLTKQALIFTSYEPITHFTQANLLAAKKNDTGAVHHYIQALELDPDFTAALDMLRNVMCISKFYQVAENRASKEQCRSNAGTCAAQKTTCTSTSAGNIIQEGGYADFDSSQVTSLGAFVRRSKLIDPEEINAMKEFHMANGMCSGSDCDHIVHKPGTDPYIKIKSYGNGKWMQRMLFVESVDDIEEEEGACHLLKGGIRTAGCNDREFTDNIQRVEQLEKVLRELNKFIKTQEKEGNVLIDNEQAFNSEMKNKKSGQLVDMDGFLDIVCTSDESGDRIHCFSKKDASPEQTELPEVTPRCSQLKKKAIRRFKPSSTDCKDYKEVDFSAFTSTWLSVAPTGIAYVNDKVTLTDVRDFLDLNAKISETEVPMCEDNIGASVYSFDHLPSIANRAKLVYGGEYVLKDTIQGLGGDMEAIDVVGTRISHALKKEKTSWVLGCLGALYWRVEGNANNAINCLRVALNYAPEESRHIPLLSMANILHRAGAFNDAIEIASQALGVSPETAVIHFSIGNMFAAKGDYSKAADYYESTVALQDSFEPARERLLAIVCGGLLDEDEENGESEEIEELNDFDPDEAQWILI